MIDADSRYLNATASAFLIVRISRNLGNSRTERSTSRRSLEIWIRPKIESFVPFGKPRDDRFLSSRHSGVSEAVPDDAGQGPDSIFPANFFSRRIGTGRVSDRHFT